MLTNGPDSFGLVSRALHWLVALLILGLVGLGWWMVGLTYYHAWYHDAPFLHKATGMVVLMLALARLGWGAYTPSPSPLSHIQGVERWLAVWVHHLLAAYMILMPLSGYLVSTSEGAGISIYGLFEVPALAPVPEWLREVAIAIHFWIGYGGAVLIGLHVTGALKHHLVDRDATLRRMVMGNGSD